MISSESIRAGTLATGIILAGVLASGLARDVDRAPWPRR